jgi:hypothetical protein
MIKLQCRRECLPSCFQSFSRTSQTTTLLKGCEGLLYLLYSPEEPCRQAEFVFHLLNAGAEIFLLLLNQQILVT